jgi:hypothetical protein
MAAENATSHLDESTATKPAKHRTPEQNDVIELTALMALFVIAVSATAAVLMSHPALFYRLCLMIVMH